MLQLKNFPEIPVSTREESREFRPHPEQPRFCLLAREVGSFPCVFWKEFPAFPSHLKRRRSPQERREELQGRATIPRVPQMSQSMFSLHSLDFQAEDRLTPRWHVEQSCGKASLESLVGKPRVKATDPLIQAKGSATLLLQLGGKRTCMPPLETRTDPLGRLQKNLKIHVSTGKESSGSAPNSHKIIGHGIDGRGILRGRRATLMGTSLP